MSASQIRRDRIFLKSAPLCLTFVRIFENFCDTHSNVCFSDRKNDNLDRPSHRRPSIPLNYFNICSSVIYFSIALVAFLKSQVIGRKKIYVVSVSTKR